MRLTNRTKELINNEKVNAKNKLLKFIFAVPFWLILASLVLMAFGICRAVYLTDSRPDQHIAEIWQSRSSVTFRHMSCLRRPARKYTNIQ